MEVLYPRCAGLDVHAKTVVGCVRIRRALPDHLLSVATAVSDHAPAASMRWTEGTSRSIYQTVPVNGNPQHSRAARHQWMHARRGAANP